MFRINQTHENTFSRVILTAPVHASLKSGERLWVRVSAPGLCVLLPGGLEHQVALGELRQPAALGQRQVLCGRPVDEVHQVQLPQAALRLGRRPRGDVLNVQHPQRAVAAPLQQQP